MKVTASHQEKAFHPVSITITFESQKELDDFGTLCNLCCITENVTVPHWRTFNSLGANIRNTTELARKIKKHASMRDV